MRIILPSHKRPLFIVCDPSEICFGSPVLVGGTPKKQVREKSEDDTTPKPRNNEK